jgi:hypothetical protein
MANLPAQIDELERVADLYLKGYKPAEIGRALHMTTVQVKRHISSYNELISIRIEDDPHFMDRLQENTVAALDKFDLLLKEAWETYETAKGADMLNQQLNAIKVIKELEIERAKLLQLMGAKVDSGMLARMNKAEKVNNIVSTVIKEVVSQCPRCKLEVMPRLAEAFDLMNRADEVADIVPVQDDIIDVEEEVEDDSHINMMADVLSND